MDTLCNLDFCCANTSGQKTFVYHIEISKNTSLEEKDKSFLIWYFRSSGLKYALDFHDKFSCPQVYEVLLHAFLNQDLRNESENNIIRLGYATYLLWPYIIPQLKLEEKNEQELLLLILKSNKDFPVREAVIPFLIKHNADLHPMSIGVKFALQTEGLIWDSIINQKLIKSLNKKTLIRFMGISSMSLNSLILCQKELAKKLERCHPSELYQLGRRIKNERVWKVIIDIINFTKLSRKQLFWLLRKFPFLWQQILFSGKFTIQEINNSILKMEIVSGEDFLVIKGLTKSELVDIAYKVDKTFFWKKVLPLVLQNNISDDKEKFLYIEKSEAVKALVSGKLKFHVSDKLAITINRHKLYSKQKRVYEKAVRGVDRRELHPGDHDLFIHLKAVKQRAVDRIQRSFIRFLFAVTMREPY